LCTINGSDITGQEDLNQRARAASFIGTLQAGYTDFHYLRKEWKETTESDALIGVSMTGIGSGKVLDVDLREAADLVVTENRRVAELLGINPAARTTTIKPEGTASLVCGSSSGIHAWHNDYYVRRMRMGKDEALYQYLKERIPALVEDDQFVPNGAVASFPQKAPEGSILRHESPAQLLDRVRKFNLEWVRTGHITGDNTHNVSCTISVKDDEWEEVAEWMWLNRNDYNGISVLPYNGGTYVQAPFEDITQEYFEELLTHLKEVDLSEVYEAENNTDLSGEIACGGGGCEV
jgi:ribonucleoside-diphosphate reductase alpha chain